MKTVLKMDKTRFMVTYDSLPEKKDHVQRFFKWQSWVVKYVQGFKHWSNKHGGSNCCSVPLSKVATLVVKHGYVEKKLRCWVEFNPSILDPESTELLADHLSMLFESGATTLIKHGVATYAEFPIDVSEAAFNDYMYFDTRMKTSNASYGAKGTMYLGASNGNRQIVVYDKSKQMFEKKNSIIEPTIRLEAKLRGAKKFKLADILNLEAPHSGLIVVAKSDLATSTHPLVKDLVSDLSKTNSSPQVVYQHFPKGQRKKLTGAAKSEFIDE
jgi:hypothetical protein